MAKFKNPLSEHQWNCFSQRFKGAASCNVDALVNELMKSIPEQAEADYGIEVRAARETITIGGLFSAKDQPGILFSFPKKPNYAQILVGLNKIGAILDVEAVQYGTVSKNMQHSNMSKADHGFSLGGMAKSALYDLITDTNAVEEENMHYSAVLDSLEGVVQSWLA